MGQPIPSATLQALRPPANATPGWRLVDAVTFAQAPPGTKTFVERIGVTALSVFGIDVNAAPTPAQMAAGLVQHGQARQVFYVEAWVQDGRILGTGTVAWWYIGVYL